eukprot:9468505-Pyramimonas_sp.AAC.2
MPREAHICASVGDTSRGYNPMPRAPISMLAHALLHASRQCIVRDSRLPSASGLLFATFVWLAPRRQLRAHRVPGARPDSIRGLIG